MLNVPFNLLQWNCKTHNLRCSSLRVSCPVPCFLPTLVPSGEPDRRNLTPVSNPSEVAPISLFWAPDGLNEIPDKFRICRQHDLKVDNAFFNRPIVTHTQVILNKNFGAVTHKRKFSSVLGWLYTLSAVYIVWDQAPQWGKKVKKTGWNSKNKSPPQTTAQVALLAHFFSSLPPSTELGPRLLQEPITRSQQLPY